jgi:hypothetical protein
MAVSKTDICNKALTLLGSNPIVSIDDDTASARALNRVYEISLRSILSECKWNFATKRADLSEASVTLDWYDSGETVVYQRPNDCIRIFGTSDEDAKWREEGEYIISDTSALGLRYVYYLDSPSKYPASFTEAFIDKLCSDIAFMVLNSKTAAETFFEKYEKVSLPKARSENAQTGIQQTMKDDGWETAKYNNTSPNA